MALNAELVLLEFDPEFDSDVEISFSAVSVTLATSPSTNASSSIASVLISTRCPAFTSNMSTSLIGTSIYTSSKFSITNNVPFAASPSLALTPVIVPLTEALI